MAMNIVAASDLGFSTAAAIQAVAAANIGAYNANFDLLVETKVPNWPHIILRINTWIDAVANALVVVGAAKVPASVLVVNEVRTRLLYGLAFFTNTCGIGAVKAGKGRGFVFKITDAANVEQRLWVKQPCIAKLISPNRAADSDTVTIYRVAAVSVKAFAQVSAQKQYAPSWYAGHAKNAELITIPYEYRSMANTNMGVVHSNSDSAKRFRNGFDEFMNGVQPKPATYKRNLALESQLAAAGETPQLFSNYPVVDDNQAVIADI